MSTSPIIAAKNAQGFVPATQRKRCASCNHVQKTGADSLQCRQGGYLVTLYAVCDRWAIKQPPGFKPATT
jgi:hypothetical protein